MFGKLLIANRGEIACRIIRTARRLSLRTVAVYSDADASARHVALADEAYRIGPPAARESYLKIDAILTAAKASGAEAIHPGYGFLSENAAFAEACATAGLTFVGPPSAAIRAMGDKSSAKALMERAGVPVVPGYHGPAQDLQTLTAAADKIGYPVLLKAAAGGGGKGMRIVDRADALVEALAGAKREAASAFADDRMLVEKYLLSPRHIEIQVFADNHGNVVHLFERDCSIQRRHQKVLEEAPAPGLSADRRRAMGEAAVACARAVGYRSAGTVEFIVDRDGRFYFMEMNTRLQVEHPVTEMITGEDLVEWQLAVAAGDRLPKRQDEIRLDGHAFEARLYAEDPARDFLPATGRLAHLAFPAEGPHVRVETGVASGDAVSIHYDPMIAKLVVWDRDRNAALARLRGALGACEIVGVPTNLALLGAIAAHPDYATGAVETGFIAAHRAALLPAPAPAPERIYALAALAVMLRLKDDALAAVQSSDRFSPWHLADGWRLNDDAWHVLRFRDPGRPAQDAEMALTVHFARRGFVIDLPGGPCAARGALKANDRIDADLAGVRCEAVVVRRGAEITTLLDGRSYPLVLVDPMTAVEADELSAGRLTAPMPGKVVAVHVAAGDAVKRGAPLLVLEAMKMEHTIVAPADGTIDGLPYAVGDQVEEGAELVKFKPAAERPAR
jgi:3-methylcrotonyl-CoA carboxylase alpha subunit